MTAPADSPSPTRARLIAGLKLLVAAAMITAIALSVDAGEAWRLLRNADPAWLAAAFAALSVQTVLSALRWRLVAARLDHPFSLRFAVREYYLSQVVNQTLPGGMLGDAGRAVRARAEAGLGLAGLAVVLERLAGQVGVVAVLSVGAVAALVWPGGLAPPIWMAGGVAGIVATLALVGGAMAVGGRLPGGLGRGAGALWANVRRGLLARDVLGWHVALSLTTAACNLLAFAACARAIGVPLSASAVMVLVPLILFAMLIPLSVSGWGLREGAAAALLPLGGATAAEGFAASVAFGLVFLAAVLPGVWPLLAVRAGQRDAPARDADDSGQIAARRSQ